MFWRYLQGTRRVVLLRAAVLIAAIALLDWRVDLNIYFGFLYVFPMLLVGTVLLRWHILSAALPVHACFPRSSILSGSTACPCRRISWFSALCRVWDCWRTR